MLYPFLKQSTRRVYSRLTRLSEVNTLLRTRVIPARSLLEEPVAHSAARWSGQSPIGSENGETSRPVRCLIIESLAMDLDREACYRAVKARDRRFDGRFLTGVLSTGIFCRPICPARTPRFENCVFFPTAAAAYSAGFRPCLRCRPEISPGVPAWSGTEATVTRALRLIAEEGPEAANLEALASRLGVGSRHLRRLFRRHVGASPSRSCKCSESFSRSN